MKSTKSIMGMHVTVEVKDGNEEKACDKVFEYFKYIDETFSTYKPTSEISKINRGEITEREYSADVKTILRLAEQTKRQTRGYFDIWRPEGYLDTSGIVKGWAIWQAGLMLQKNGHKYFFIDAGGDIQARVADKSRQAWEVGIRNPFNKEQIVKVLKITDEGVATSGNYERGAHIYDPHRPNQPLDEIVSLTVIGPNIYEADRFATAAFAMGKTGINFIESLPGLEGYMIDKDGTGTKTSNFEKYCVRY